MIYITTVLQYLDRHIWWIVIAMGATYIAYIAINMIFSPYMRHNHLVRRSICQLRQTATTGKVVPFVAGIPLQYRAQWHCYTTAHSVPAVSMFTPVHHSSSRKMTVLLFSSWASAVICGVVAVVYSSNSVAVYALFVYITISIAMYALMSIVRNRQYGVACRIFSRWVALVQAYFGSGDIGASTPAKRDDIEDMIEQLRLVKRCDKQEVPAKVASILSSQPQNVERTVAQQRKINNVLNELLVIGG